MGDKLCIICEKPVEGKRAVKVREDNILKLIRDFKRVTNTARNNELYVCEEDLPKHTERRKNFQKAIMLFGVGAVLVFLLAIISMVIAGSFNAIGLLSALVICALLIMFAVILKYTPDVEAQSAAPIGAARAAEAKAAAKTSLVSAAAKTPVAVKASATAKKPVKTKR
ncbi:MAG: hypothetical protein V1492_02755 [Candidatus Micrarchaeota archaeon]